MNMNDNQPQKHTQGTSDNCYSRVCRLLEGTHDDVSAPEGMRDHVFKSIEQYTTMKALLELHVLAPGLIAGIEPDSVEQDKKDEDNNTSPSGTADT